MSTSSVIAGKSQKPADLAAELRRRIKRGQWKPGERLPSYSESRAMFGAHSVAVEKAHAQLEREGLIIRERGRGTFVARQVSREAKTRSGLIGVAGKGFSFKEYSPYWVSMLCGIRSACDEADAQVLLLDHQSNKGWEKAEGVLICDWSNQLTMQWLPPAMPCVSLMMSVPGTVSVYADDHGGARTATEHLLKLGHRKIGFLHSADTGISSLRQAGWRDALHEAGVTVQPEWNRTFLGNYDFGEHFVASARESMRHWLATDWKETGCTALLAHNDEAAIGMVQALREAGLRVPEDVSVVGFDGAPGGEWVSHRLTTMQVPLEEIGRGAANLLLRQLNGETVGSAHQVFPIALRQGGSTTNIAEQNCTAKEAP